MILPLFRRSRRPGTISILYGTIVAQARLPCFYRDYGVPDTVNGRFDLIVAHLAVILKFLTAQNAPIRELGQALFDHFCADMDDNLRQMGVGDLTVPKQMNRIGEAFYGRSKAYAEALNSHDGGLLTEALARNVFDSSETIPMGARRLATYIRALAEETARLDGGAWMRGVLTFPDPATLLIRQRFDDDPKPE
jgi:cytochrome b pre-mRNA-processing protein 3